jgi:hypothetical protein
MENHGMKNTLKNFGYICIIPLIICIFFSENIWGYIKFKQYCAAHPQFFITEKLEPNVGWQSDLEKAPESKSIVGEYLYFTPQIKFFRFRDYSERQTVLDSKFIGLNRISNADYEKLPRNIWPAKLPADDPSNFSFEPANLDEKTIYQYEWFDEFIPNQIRLRHVGERVIDLRTNKTVVESGEYVYRIFDKEIYNYNGICGDALKLLHELKTTNNNQLFKKN